MIKTALILISVLISFNTYSQFLTFDELVQLRKKDFTQINDFLTNKGWQFSHSSEGSETTYNEVNWSFGKSEWDEGKAISWLTLYSSDGYENRITFQEHNKDSYTLINNKIKSYSMKKINSKIQDNNIYTDYVGQTVVVRVIISSEEYSSKTIYIFKFFEKEDYYNMILSDYFKDAYKYSNNSYSNNTGNYSNNNNSEYSKSNTNNSNTNNNDNKYNSELDLNSNSGLDMNSVELVVTNGTLLKSKPDDNSDKIIQVYSKDKVKILSRNTSNSKYWYVEYKSYKGYILKVAFRK